MLKLYDGQGRGGLTFPVTVRKIEIIVLANFIAGAAEMPGGRR